MALVCDIKSDAAKPEEAKPEEENDDLEDGEIEDDDDADEPMPPPAPLPPPSTQPPLEPPIRLPDTSVPPPRFDVKPPEIKEKLDKKQQKKHLTEAEKSVMRLHKIERQEREKRDKYRREQTLHPLEPEDDFATAIEKAIAMVLKKDKVTSEDEKPVEEKRGKKRKKKDKHKKFKRGKQEAPLIEDFEEVEMLNVRGGSPPPQRSDDESQGSETSSERSGEEKRKHSNKRNFERRKFQDRNRKKNRENAEEKKGGGGIPKRNTGVCLYYLQGHCNDDNCPYSHETVQPVKLELCKFYLLECCVKGDKCLYMHSDFPCKFYHTGIPCPFNENCKFAHGGPLSDGLKQILFKHIETAPKEILGNFPRLSRDNAMVMIAQAQKVLEGKYGQKDKDHAIEIDDKDDIPSLFDINFANPPPDTAQCEANSDNGRKENKRCRKSRWQDPEPLEQDKMNSVLGFGLQGGLQDQDMRFSSNGDVDMRTLPTPNIINPNILLPPALMQQTGDNAIIQIKQEPSSNDTDIRQLDVRKDIDIRQMNRNVPSTDEDEPESGLQIVMDEELIEPKLEPKLEPLDDKTDMLENLPKKQRELFKRIQAQQRETYYEEPTNTSDNDEPNIDWYSDDDDDNKLMIKDDFDEPKLEIKLEPEEDIKPEPLEVMEKLGDLSKIDISADITKLLSTISKQASIAMQAENPAPFIELGERRDPRQQVNENKDPRQVVERRDPRRGRVGSSEDTTSIYDQGSIKDASRDVDLRQKDQRTDEFNDLDLRSSGRSDVDLRQLGLPFKGMANYTPACEIDASFNSHPPLTWRVYIVEIPKPDYTGLKLSASDAQTTGDPRLRKIFRISVDEKESPASPKESPKAPAPARIDPRRKKMEAEAAKVLQEPPPIIGMPYTQQLSMLQGSPFYQTLTSNQKLMLNQELASRNDQSGQSDPIISAMLQNLGLISPAAQTQGGQSQALNIIANVNSLGFPNQVPMMPGPGQGILGPAPSMQNLPPPDFPMNFDPRTTPGLLGNGPPPFTNNFQPPPDVRDNFGGGGGFNDDFYPEQGGFNGNNDGNNRNRGNFHERQGGGRRGRNNANNNRNKRNFFRHNNRNRNRSSPQ